MCTLCSGSNPSCSVYKVARLWHICMSFNRWRPCSDECIVGWLYVAIRADTISMCFTSFRRVCVCVRRVHGCLDAACDWDGGDCCENSCNSAEYTCGSRGYSCLDPHQEQEPYASCEGVNIFIADGDCDEFNNNAGKWSYLAPFFAKRVFCFGHLMPTKAYLEQTCFCRGWCVNRFHS